MPFSSYIPPVEESSDEFLKLRSRLYTCEVVMDEKPFDLSGVYFLNTINKEDSLTLFINHLYKFVSTQTESSISANVYNTCLNVLNNLSPSICGNLDLSNIYCSSNGTVILDWNGKNERDIFSLEIGRNCIGYFSEKGGIDVKQVELLSIDSENFEENIQVLNKDLSEFL